MNVAVQIFGLIAITMWLVGTQSKNKKEILLTQMISSIFYCLQYICLKAYTGALTDLVTIIRNIVFYFEEKHNKEISKISLIIFMIIIILVGTISFENIYCLLIIFASILYLIAVWVKNFQLTRVLCIISAMGWLSYNYLVGAYVNCIGNSLEIILLIIAMIRYRGTNNEEI